MSETGLVVAFSLCGRRAGELEHSCLRARARGLGGLRAYVDNTAGLLIVNCAWYSAGLSLAAA